MSFYELLLQRKSIRKFDDRKIEHKKVETLKKAALLSPSGKRKNHWDFIFVEDTESLSRLSESKQHGSKLIAGAALAVVIIGDETISDTWIEDCSIASILLQLQAEELDLGSCWVQIHKRMKNDTEKSEAYVKSLFEIPEEKRVLSIIAFGYPQEKRAPHNESELLLNKIHLEKY